MIIRDVLDDDIEVAIKVGFFSFILSLVLKQEKNYVIALGGTDLFRHLSIEKSN